MIKRKNVVALWMYKIFILIPAMLWLIWSVIVFLFDAEYAFSIIKRRAGMVKDAIAAIKNRD